MDKRYASVHVRVTIAVAYRGSGQAKVKGGVKREMPMRRRGSFHGTTGIGNTEGYQGTYLCLSA